MQDIKKIAISMDSPGDLPKDIAEKNQITIIPLNILLGSNTYLDGVDIHPQDIYEYVKENEILPKTSAVTPNKYYEVFSSLVGQGYKVIHISLASAISSTYQNACIAASEFDEQVFVIDSKSLCTAMGLLALKACDLRDEGMDISKIVKELKKTVPKIHTTFIVDSLEYLHKGGRCSGVARFGANVLGIKPSIIQNTKTGELEVGKKYRGKMNAIYGQYVSDTLSNINEIDQSRIVIANSGGGISEDVLNFTKGLIETKANFRTIIEADAGCTISSHCGPKTLAIFYIKK